jgi:3-phytase
MKPVDNGGIEMFVGEAGIEYRSLMGIGLYKDSAGQIFAIDIWALFPRSL